MVVAACWAAAGKLAGALGEAVGHRQQVEGALGAGATLDSCLLLLLLLGAALAGAATRLQAAHRCRQVAAFWGSGHSNNWSLLGVLLPVCCCQHTEAVCLLLLLLLVREASTAAFGTNWVHKKLTCWARACWQRRGHWWRRQPWLWSCGEWGRLGQRHAGQAPMWQLLALLCCLLLTDFLFLQDR